MKACGNCYYWDRDLDTEFGTCERLRYSSQSRWTALCTSASISCDFWYKAGDGLIKRRWLDQPGRFN